IDRVDFTKPTAELANPEFNDRANWGASSNDVFIVGQYFSQFSIQLSDIGTGVDPLSVANPYGFVYEHVISVIEKIWTGTQWEEKELVLGYDYFANYNAATGLIVLTPSRGMWSSEATYVIELNNSTNFTPSIVRRLNTLLNTLAADKAPKEVLDLLTATRDDFLDNPQASSPAYLITELGKLTAALKLLPQSSDPGRTTAINRISTLTDWISKGGICDLAGNLLEANRPDDTTLFTITMTGYTFSDAPEKYGIASHIVTPGYHLGEGVAVMRNANPSIRADSNKYDDGVKLKDPQLIAGKTNQIGVKITVSDEVLQGAKDTDVVGYLSMWFDWDGDGKFSDAERVQKPITKALLATADSNGYIWLDIDVPAKTLIPDNAESGEVFARFRFSSERIDSPTALAKDGEVEDYMFPLMKNLHNGGNVAQKGVQGYNERTGKYDIALEDYWLVSGESSKAQATISNSTIPNKPAYLYAWILVNDTWIQVLGTNNTGHRINGSGENINTEILLNLPAGIDPGKYKIRFRLTTDATLTATGIASDGEFKDYMINVVANRSNYGTAPGNIASHIIKRGTQQLSFGTTVIAGQAGQNAKDYQDFVDNYTPPKYTQNDGLVDYRLVAGGASYIEVIVTNTTGKSAWVDIWVDMNNSMTFDGKFGDLVTEHLVHFELNPTNPTANLPKGTTVDVISPGVFAIRFDVTIPDFKPSDKPSIMRMRLSDQNGVGPTGSTALVNGKEVAVYGEVEDWLVSVMAKNGGATISGNVFHDLNGTGEYGTVNVDVPSPNVSSQKGAVVPFVTGRELDYSNFRNAPGVSSYPTMLPNGITVEIGGRSFDSFIATDKGAIMLINYQDYYGIWDPYTGQYVYQNIGVPSLYSGTYPTFAPFLSGMITDAEVTYSYGTDADGLNYVKITWTVKIGVERAKDKDGKDIIGNDGKPVMKDVFGDFGVLITDDPVGDVVSYFYSMEFLDWVKDIETYSVVQIGTNFGNTALNNANARARQSFTTKTQLLSYLDGLRYAIVPSSPNNLPSSQYTGVIPKTGKINEKPTLTGV
ncbi:MAG: GEVED domain-containing protein, partial [Planctomycetaceae bacterium]|nr:GEVED domain-containing protein [Planctomycetaceae bacterium]